jgi:nicotinate-nucleotide adenylyltransferase
LGRIGILGGTFNPPHLGHLALARHARDELGLGRVLLMPVRTPPHKVAPTDPGADHRLRMCALLVGGEPGLEACDLELRREGPSYTVETLRSLRDHEPEARLTFVAGADAARTLPVWREPEELLSLAELAVAARGGAEREEVLDALAPLGARVRFLDMPLLEISSSEVRERAARGEPVQTLVGERVAGYIAEQRLYGAGEGSG